jgi:hypothetical protein
VQPNSEPQGDGAIDTAVGYRGAIGAGILGHQRAPVVIADFLGDAEGDVKGEGENGIQRVANRVCLQKHLGQCGGITKAELVDVFVHPV